MTISRPARELLFACAVWDPTPHELDRVRDAARGLMDWDEWLTLVRWHRLIPHASRALAGANAHVPPEIAATLKEESLAIAAASLARARQLADLLGTLGRAGVSTLPFKGPVLALAAYGNVGVRDSFDLDVVVREADLDAARAAMLATGYVSRSQMSPAQERMLQRSFGHYSYTRELEPAPVELHWRFAAPRYPWSLPPEDVLSRADTRTLGGVAVAVPSPTDQLLLQAMHGARHQWERIEWLVAFAQLLRKARVDEVTLLDRARDHGSDRALRVALRLARDLLGASLPARLDSAADDALVSSLAKQIERSLDSAEHSTDQPYAFNLQMMDSPRARTHYLRVSAFHPTMREWELVRLPDALLPLYYPIRAARVLAIRVTSLFVRR